MPYSYADYFGVSESGKHVYIFNKNGTVVFEIHETIQH